ncbi:MAG: TauD/TfdA family dioxygenase, partial [Alphaproteobacteria bacterium]
MAETMAGTMAGTRIEPKAEWRQADFADPARFTEILSSSEQDEIAAAVAHAAAMSNNMLEIGKDDFPLPTLAPRMKRIEDELINGRGFVLIRGLPRDRFSNDEMCLAYWGLGMHLGKPWPQNHKGHMLGDVTDQGKAENDPTARGNELGGMALPFHTDGSDLVGLMCLENGIEGGESVICNSVALYNQLMTEDAEMAEELFNPQPYDFRGEQQDGGKPYYEMPVFT